MYFINIYIFIQVQARIKRGAIGAIVPLQIKKNKKIINILLYQNMIKIKLYNFDCGF